MGDGEQKVRNMANHLAQHIQAYCHTQCDDVYLLVVLAWDHNGARVLRYFRLGANGQATEWVQDGPCPFVANAP